MRSCHLSDVTSQLHLQSTDWHFLGPCSSQKKTPCQESGVFRRFHQLMRSRKSIPASLGDGQGRKVEKQREDPVTFAEQGLHARKPLCASSHWVPIATLQGSSILPILQKRRNYSFGSISLWVTQLECEGRFDRKVFLLSYHIEVKQTFVTLHKKLGFTWLSLAAESYIKYQSPGTKCGFKNSYYYLCISTNMKGISFIPTVMFLQSPSSTSQSCSRTSHTQTFHSVVCPLAPPPPLPFPSLAKSFPLSCLSGLSPNKQLQILF